MLMASFMGAFCMAFFTMFGLENPEALFGAMRWGARIAIGFSVLILMGIALATLIPSEETSGKLQFVLGGLLAAALSVVFDIFIADHLIQFVVEHPAMFGFDSHPGIL